jgi:nucleotide-binding universal stress UspA family protein
VEIARSAGFEAEPLCVRSTDGVWPTLVQLAEDRDVRAVVVGRRGLSAVGSVLLGSVSSGIAHHCRRPVLVIPAR